MSEHVRNIKQNREGELNCNGADDKDNPRPCTPAHDWVFSICSAVDDSNRSIVGHMIWQCSIVVVLRLFEETSAAKARYESMHRMVSLEI